MYKPGFFIFIALLLLIASIANHASADDDDNSNCEVDGCSDAGFICGLDRETKTTKCIPDCTNLDCDDPRSVCVIDADTGKPICKSPKCPQPCVSDILCRFRDWQGTISACVAPSLSNSMCFGACSSTQICRYGDAVGWTGVCQDVAWPTCDPSCDDNSACLFEYPWTTTPVCREVKCKTPCGVHQDCVYPTADAVEPTCVDHKLQCSDITCPNDNERCHWLSADSMDVGCVTAPHKCDVYGTSCGSHMECKWYGTRARPSTTCVFSQATCEHSCNYGYTCEWESAENDNTYCRPRLAQMIFSLPVTVTPTGDITNLDLYPQQTKRIHDIIMDTIAGIPQCSDPLVKYISPVIYNTDENDDNSITSFTVYTMVSAERLLNDCTASLIQAAAENAMTLHAQSIYEASIPPKFPQDQLPSPWFQSIDVGSMISQASSCNPYPNDANPAPALCGRDAGGCYFDCDTRSACTDDSDCASHGDKFICTSQNICDYNITMLPIDPEPGQGGGDDDNTSQENNMATQNHVVSFHTVTVMSLIALLVCIAL